MVATLIPDVKDVAREPESDELFTTRELARRYKVSEGTIRNWRRRGLIGEPLRVGRCVRYRAGHIPR